MLICFRVSNFASFRDAVELSMVAARSGLNEDQVSEIGDMRILRTSAMFGANASGKSNLIKAIDAMKKLVVFDKSIESERSFRPDPAMSHKASCFEVEVEIEGATYSYGFEYMLSRQEVTEEWLYRIYPDKVSDVIFTRVGSVIEHPFSGIDKQRMDLYAEDVIWNPKRLLLNVMGRKAQLREGPLGIFNDVYDWFDTGLVLMDVDFPFSPEVAVSDEDLENLNRMLSTFGTGVNKVAYERKPSFEDLLPQSLLERIRIDLRSSRGPATMSPGKKRYVSVGGFRASIEDEKVVLDELLYRHEGDKVSYRPVEESDGTRKLYSLLVSIFLRKDGSTFVIDELDTSLHPQLVYRFVKLFLECGDKARSQLIFSTHESYLLDFNLLRRDEIWFLEKDRNGRSRLYSLEEFNERLDRRIEKAYREGRYGGVPRFSSIYPPRGDE